MPLPGVCPEPVVPCALVDEHAGPEQRYCWDVTPAVVTSVTVKVDCE